MAAIFLEKWKLSARVPASDEEIRDLRSFRNALQGYARLLASGGSLTEKDLGELNQKMAAGPVIRRLAVEDGSSRIGLLPVNSSWEQVAAEAAADFVRTVTEGESTRIRICDNPDCLWFFYDDTRSRTKRFCEDKTCGNLMKVRRFRARRKGAGPGGH